MVGDIAEVRLGGAVERRDDLVAAGGDGVGVTGDLVEQPAGPRGGVVDLVDVGAQLATARRPFRRSRCPRRPSPVVPGVSTSSCLTAGAVVASRVAMAAVPTSTPSSGIAG